MEKLLGSIKSKLASIIQFSVWLFSILASFIFPPQINNFTDDANTLTNLAKFIMAILVGLLLIPFYLYGIRKYMSRWLVITILSFVIGAIFYYYYDHFRQTKRVEYQSQIFAIGDDEDLTEAALELKKDLEPPKVSNSDLIKYFAPQKPEDLNYIWNESGIKYNRLMIIFIYMTTLVFFAICLLTLVQTLKCLWKE